MSHSRLIFWGSLAIVMAVAGCAGSEYLLNEDNAGNYDFESQPLHPQYYVYHSDDDSTTVYFRISASEILYMRKSPDDPFEARLTFRTRLYKHGEDMELVDSSSFVKISQRQNEATRFAGTFTIPCPSSTRYSLEIECTDESRNARQSQSIRIVKDSKFHRQNYLITHESTGVPLYSYHAEEGSSICVENARLDTSRLELIQFDLNEKLPAPPFSDNRRDWQDPSTDSGLTLTSNEEGRVCFDVLGGDYYFSHDPEKMRGVHISTQNEFFPQVKTAKTLAETMRYITSRSEYETLNQEVDRKLKVENFWIDCAGSKDRARELIRIYYGRVTEANYYFSDVLPGWKTDRGLVHIVYGNPKKIYQYENYETWLYGEEDNLNSLSFTFARKENSLSDSYFELRRDISYKTSWERAITSWRNGKVYSD